MLNAILAHSQIEKQIYHGGRGHAGTCKEEKIGGVGMGIKAYFSSNLKKNHGNIKK
jgi:hypothetical protein